MVIGFLQSYDPPLLPNLQDDKLLETSIDEHNPKQINQIKLSLTGLFKKNKSIHFTQKNISAKFYDDLELVQESFRFINESESNSSINDISLSKLILDFFLFYFYEFQKDKMAIDIRSGGIISNKSKGKGMFVIIDPIIGTEVGAGCKLNSKNHLHYETFVKQFFENIMLHEK